VLARVAGQVVALEQDPGLTQCARASLASQPNVKVESGPLTAGWAPGGPYDGILLEGAVEFVPEPLLRQLNDGGRLVCVLGAGPGAKATVFYRSGKDIGSRTLFDAAAAVLPGFLKPPEFAF
jgi:protein-L-isoaspartate(D-aspartate) O-methyltransferase